MTTTQEMAQDLVDMFDVNGHDVGLLDLLDCLASVGLTLRNDDGSGEASSIYIGLLQKAAEKRKVTQ